MSENRSSIVAGMRVERLAQTSANITYVVFAADGTPVERFTLPGAWLVMATAQQVDERVRHEVQSIADRLHGAEA